MNKRIPLARFLEEQKLSQAAAAEMAGVTQGYVSRLIRERRIVHVLPQDDGTVLLEESRIIGRRRRNVA